MGVCPECTSRAWAFSDQDRAHGRWSILSPQLLNDSITAALDDQGKTLQSLWGSDRFPTHQNFSLAQHLRGWIHLMCDLTAITESHGAGTETRQQLLGRGNNRLTQTATELPSNPQARRVQ
jgi:hypothetical protein